MPEVAFADQGECDCMRSNISGPEDALPYAFLLAAISPSAPTNLSRSSILV